MPSRRRSAATKIERSASLTSVSPMVMRPVVFCSRPAGDRIGDLHLLAEIVVDEQPRGVRMRRAGQDAEVEADIGQHFGEILNDFQAAHPGIAIDLALIDRSVNPMEEDFDIAVGAMPASYANVIDEPLSPYPRVLCAAPSYLEARGEPKHPIDLIGHDCLTFHTTGSTWSFESPRGLINVDVRSRFAANDSQILQSAACRGLGIAMVARYIARPEIESGRLKTLLPDYPVPKLWLKALIPTNKARRPAVQSLLGWIKQRMQPLPSRAV